MCVCVRGWVDGCAFHIRGVCGCVWVCVGVCVRRPHLSLSLSLSVSLSLALSLPGPYALLLLARQYTYFCTSKASFCTSKASKIHTPSPAAYSRASVYVLLYQ